jgi:hypothetical protein
MNETVGPRTISGRALAAWGRRSQAMAETIARIEHEAVDDFLASEETLRLLEQALAAGRDPRAILAALRQPRR